KACILLEIACKGGDRTPVLRSPVPFFRTRSLIAAVAVPTATAAAAATTAAVAATTARAAAAAFGPGFRLVDSQAATARVLPIQGGDGRLGLLVALHFHETKALRPPRVPVHDDLGRLHGAVRLKHLREITVGYVVIQVADVQLLTHFL